MTGLKLTTTLAAALIVLCVFAPPAAAQDADLIKSLVSGLGVTETQAIGGTKALIDAAKTGLSGDEFSQLTALPQLAGVMGGGTSDAADTASAAAEATDVAGMAASAMGDAGGSEDGSSSLGALTDAATSQMEGMDLSQLSDIAGLASSFSDLGLSADMAQKFLPIVMNGLGGSTGKNLLMKGLGLL